MNFTHWHLFLIETDACDIWHPNIVIYYPSSTNEDAAFVICCVNKRIYPFIYSCTCFVYFAHVKTLLHHWHNVWKLLYALVKFPGLDLLIYLFHIPARSSMSRPISLGVNWSWCTWAPGHLATGLRSGWPWPLWPCPLASPRCISSYPWRAGCSRSGFLPHPTSPTR